MEMQNGAKTLSFSSQKNGTEWNASNIIDGNSINKCGKSWSSSKYNKFPHKFVFKLSAWAMLQEIVFCMQDIASPDKWPDKVKIYASMYPDSNFVKLKTVYLNKKDSIQSFKLPLIGHAYRLPEN